MSLAAAERRLDLLEERPLRETPHWIPSDRMRFVVQTADSRWLCRFERWWNSWRLEVRNCDILSSMNQPDQNTYWNAMPLPVQALRTAGSEGEAASLAKQLADAGYTIDEEIMVHRLMLPGDVFFIRAQNGFRWVPSLNQPNIPTMPGDDLPGYPPYDSNHPPAGSIHVPFNAGDYINGPEQPPPIIPAKPPMPQVGEAFVTASGTIYLPGPGLNQPQTSEGMQFEQDGVKYTAHVNYSKQIQIWFTKD